MAIITWGLNISFFQITLLNSKLLRKINVYVKIMKSSVETWTSEKLPSLWSKSLQCDWTSCHLCIQKVCVQLKNEPLLESRWCIFWCLQCGDRSQHFCGYSVSFLHLKNCNHGSQTQKQFDVVITVGYITNTFDLWGKLFKIFFTFPELAFWFTVVNIS